MNDLLTADEFNAILSGWFGRTASLTARTKTTSNISGAETFTTGTPSSITCFFIRASQAWVFDKSGQIENGDAIALTKIADAVKKDDLITAEGLTYVVKDIINVPGQFSSSSSPTFIYSVCNLFLWNG